MNKLFAGAMMTVMALCIFGLALPIGGVTPEVAAPAYACVALLAALWVGWLLVARTEPSWTNSPMHWPVALFVLYALGRYFTAPVEYDARQEMFLIGACALVYFVTSSYFHRPRDRAFFLILIMVVALFEAGYGMWQAFTKFNQVFWWERPETYAGRASGTFIYPNQFASFLEMCLGLVLARAVYVSRESLLTERAVLLKVLTLYVVIMIVVALVLTGSRAAWFSATVGIIIFVLTGGWRWRVAWLRLAMVVLVVGVVGVALLRLDSVSLRLQRTFQVNERGIPRLGDGSLGGRTYMWKGTLEMIRDHPFLGTGPGSWQWIFQKHKDPRLTTHPEYAHNDIINLMSDYGLVGFLLVLGLLAAFYRHARVTMRAAATPEQVAFAVGAIVSVTTLLIHCWFDFSLHIPINAVLLAAILGMTAGMDPDPNQPKRCAPPWWVRYPAPAIVLAMCAVGLWRLVPTAMAARYVDLGNRVRGELDYNGALAYYDRATALDPGFPEPWVRIGDVNRTGATWRLGPAKAEERKLFALAAVEAYDRALELNPYDSFALVSRARMLAMAGKSEEAGKGFERAIEADPGNAYSYFIFGCYHRDLGNPQRAQELFTRSREINHALSAGLNSYELEQQGFEPRASSQPADQ